MNFPPPARVLWYEQQWPRSQETLYEQTFVLRSQLGDEAAFEELLELHGPRFARTFAQSGQTYREARSGCY